MYVYMYVCVYVCLYVCTCVCIYEHVCMYLYISNVLQPPTPHHLIVTPWRVYGAGIIRAAQIYTFIGTVRKYTTAP
jgi:hypothetical protein